MRYQFSFYKQENFEELVALAKKAYQWECPFVSLSRMLSCRGFHPRFKDNANAWEYTIGMYWENEQLVACVWNEGIYEGEEFFLFDSKERAQEVELLQDMINYARMYCTNIEDGNVRSMNIWVPEWNETLKKLVLEKGMTKGGWQDHCYIFEFEKKHYEVKLPEGYSIIDGNTTPAFYLSNVHRVAFGYGNNEYACEHGAEAFEDIRKMKYYDKDLELCVLDAYGRPVAIANIWADPDLEYCELEPLGVVWWERRKGLGTAILHEAMNRVLAKYPKCKGMRGGDQPFYHNIGFKEMESISNYTWKRKVIISWEDGSKDENYAKEMEW